MEVEEYNEYGEIVRRSPRPVIYERKMTTHQQHRIHETKDLLESDCYLCQKAATKHQKSYWANDD